MKTKGYFHLIVTSFVLMCAAALTVKGFFFADHTRLLLSDTGIVPIRFADPIAFVIPLMLGISVLTALFGITTLLPVVAAFCIHIALQGLALYQGLHFDCGCYLSGSLQSEVYSTLQPQFITLLLVLSVSAALYYFNNLANHRAMTPSV
ncbi:MauE/DoxX family redox-associated membrane protein [Photobacterium kagoshimensis]|uniref:MauE/DoxX family redox-associated membrane protein n=1 Tax=Photobacterium kagoshimensis TaxID=2910242 RepID=UPI003D095DFB